MTVANINPEKEPIPQSWVPRVITGGKEPPSEFENWLERLSVGTVFVACFENSYEANYFELIFKGEKFFLLHKDIDDDTIREIYVHPRRFCKSHQEYEILGINPPKEEELENEQRDRSD